MAHEAPSAPAPAPASPAAADVLPGERVGVFGCAAPWSDLFVSAADNRTNNCCYYNGSGATTFRPDGSLRSVKELWNAPGILSIRRLQAGRARLQGCKECPYSIDMPEDTRRGYFEFRPPEALTGQQETNLELAGRERDGGVLRLRSLPVRYVLCFGWFCNLSCPICIQMPHRDHMSATLPADLFEQWRGQLSTAIQVECIGGEVFTIPSALAFMRAFVDAPEMAPVRLRITSNGMLLHKHMDWLKAKDRISFNISIDSIGSTYEKLRVNGQWDQIQKNLIGVAEAIRGDKGEWSLATNGLITRSVIPVLPEYARFHADNGIHTHFALPIFTRGNEQFLYQEDVMRFPALLDEVPGWRDSFAEAIRTLEDGGLTVPATQLRGIFGDLRDRSSASVSRTLSGRKIAEVSGSEGLLGLIAGCVGNDNDKAAPDIALGLASFISSDSHFGLIVRIDLRDALPEDGVIGLRLAWPATLPAQTIHCQTTLYDAQRFKLLEWTERRETGERVIDLIAWNPSPGGANTLLLTLMNARRNIRNILPHRLEIWSTAPR